MAMVYIQGMDLLTKALEDSILIQKARKAISLSIEAGELEQVFEKTDLASSTAYMKAYLHEKKLTNDYETWLADLHRAYMRAK